MGFSYRVGKGVRVRVSSRGVRTSIGPRSARLHVGAGRTGVSTGAGPVTYYTSVGGRGGRSAGSQTVGASQRQLAQAQKAEEAEVLAAAVQHILNLHRQAFPAAEVPVAPSPVPLDEEAIRKRHEAAALDGIGLFNRGERRHARQRAAAAADEEIRGKKDRQEHERREAQRQLEATWKLLLANEPTVVLAALEEAFEDNEARAAPLDVDGDEVELVVLSPSPEVLPERLPATTAAGNLTLKKIAKADRSTLYRAMVCGHVLATVREAFAVAPSINAARVVALRSPPPDSYGRARVEVLLAARFDRGALDGIDWQRADAADIVGDAATELVLNVKGQAKELQPIDLAKEPELAELVNHVEVGDLTATPG